MALFLITYDAHYDRDYADLYEAFDGLDIGRIMDSVWLGEINNTAKEVREWVRGLLDDDDSILVIEMKPKHMYAGRKLGEGVGDWLKSLLWPD